MHLFKKYLNFSNKINFCKLAIDLENGVNVPKHSQPFRLPSRYSCAGLVGIKPKIKRYMDHSL